MPHSLLKRLWQCLCCHRDEHHDISADHFSWESASTEMGCIVCRLREPYRPDVYSPIPFTHLIKSGESCAICKLLLDIAISYEPDKQIREAGVMALIGRFFGAETTPRSWFRLHWVAGNKTLYLRIFYRSIEPTGNARNFPFFAFPSRPLPRETSSQQSLQWAIAQITKCNKEHACYDVAVMPPLPARVLDIEAPGTGLRLHLTSNEPGRYVCLSHCWGQMGANGKTTCQNLPLRMQGIVVETLPKTFQDAIDITRRLGVRYLWIDSLCIIQEDEEDWLKEAPQMVTIFENAYLTIGATASSESNSGCYRSISQEAYEREFVYGGGCFKTPAATLYVREQIPHFGNRNSDEVRNREFPLLERAWVYQEQILSSRMLHFCNMELFFECKEVADCQCEEVTRFESTNKVLLNKLLRTKNQNVVFSWPAFVEDYTELKMTYDKDRLPAFSSIARKVAQLNPGDCYLAGMWESTLLQSLFWGIIHGKRQRYRPAEPRAPSWSWASAFGSISWRDAKRLPDKQRDSIIPDTQYQVYAALVRAECNPVDGDPFGRVNSGIMTLSGKVTPCLLTWSTLDDVDPQMPGWKVAAFDNLPYDRSDGLSQFCFHADYLFHLDMPGHLDIFCLWLYQRYIGQWTGLVLRQVNQTFERIGVFQIYLEEGHIPWDIVESIDLTMDII